ncbi:hypothetical protein R5O24_02820 [Tenacibaculum maritimum]|uniref:hypothetical protein n=1 Tax=Tenacibaculum maritimum TaxID=107401 RepID=UPI00388D35E9
MGKQSYSIETIFENRPTIETYSQLQGKVKEFVDDIIKDSIKPNKVLRLNGKELNPKQEDLWFLSWGDMIELRESINEMKMIESLKLIYEIKEDEFLRLDVFNCFAVYKWITEQLKSIAEIEAQELSHEPTAEEKNAGVDMLQDFDYTVSLDVLANGDLLKYDEILEKPYAIIFRKLCLDKLKNQIQQNFIENARRKVKGGY